jgi:hypothetical protein
MSPAFTRLAIPLLRWTLSLVVILESVQFVLSAPAAHLFAKMGLPAWVRPALGISEVLAAVLFLVPSTTMLGGYLLLVVFGLAAMVHVLHGQFGIGGLVVYAIATLVCMSYRQNKLTEASHE